MNQTKDTPPKPSPYRSFLVAAVLFLLALLATAGVKSYRELAAARAHLADLKHQIEASEGRIRVLREHVRTIEDDPLTLERLAREQLGMVRAGDVVIVLPEVEPPPPSKDP